LSVHSVNSIRCSKVEISEAGISELDGKRVVAAIPREQIREIKLCCESCAKYPFFQYFMGFNLLALGVIGLFVVFLASAKRPLVPTEPGTFVLPMIPIILWVMVGIGFSFLIKVIRTRYHLAVETEGGIRKLFFDRKMKVDEIRQFLRKAKFYFGYTVDVSILEKKHLSSP
jgi:hypothetical protein